MKKINIYMRNGCFFILKNCSDKDFEDILEWMGSFKTHMTWLRDRKVWFKKKDVICIEIVDDTPVITLAEAVQEKLEERNAEFPGDVPLC